MTNVKILKRFPIALDGLKVETWRAGDEKTVDDDVLEILIGEGACEIIEDKKKTRRRRTS